MRVIGWRSTDSSAEMISLVFKPDARPLKLMGAPAEELIEPIAMASLLLQRRSGRDLERLGRRDRFQHPSIAVAHLDRRAPALRVPGEAQFATL